MPYAVVLDACVLHPAHLRHTLLRPDDFLLDALDLDPSTVIEELRQQASANRISPHTLFEILDALSTAGTPRFADEIRRRV